MPSLLISPSRCNTSCWVLISTPEVGSSSTRSWRIVHQRTGKKRALALSAGGIRYVLMQAAVNAESVSQFMHALALFLARPWPIAAAGVEAHHDHFFHRNGESPVHTSQLRHIADVPGCTCAYRLPVQKHLARVSGMRTKMVLSSVVLPHPVGPTTPAKLAVAISSERSANTHHGLHRRRSRPLRHYRVRVFPRLSGLILLVSTFAMQSGSPPSAPS